MRREKKFRCMFAALFCFAMVIALFCGTRISESPEIHAAEEEDSATLRLIFTSDIHGQLTTEDYETGGGAYTSGGLSRAATIIKTAKQEVDTSNSLLFDLGDNFFDYTTDYIYNYSSSAKQPCYQALNKIGYDAITLGNHEFDYSLTYLKNQLSWAGLSDKVVLSNVKDAVTKKNVWAENKIITKKLKTSSGQEMEVKVGLIGETVPSLSKKRSNYTTVLSTEDIVQNVKGQVTKLKDKGADVIVVLAHSGIGSAKPENKADNAGYALTKIDGVDAVLCGHAHRDFPVSSGSIYDNLPGVDLETGLTNDKVLIQVANRASSVGVADLKLSVVDNKVVISKKSTEVRKVNKNTEVDQTINDIFGATWLKRFLADCDTELAGVSLNTDLQNYFAPQEDSEVIQLLNQIKMMYALKYINAAAPEHKNLPVIAASTNLKDGSEDATDYVDITESFKKNNIHNLVDYHTGLYVYKITGAQLREWVEFSASCYEQADKNLLIQGTEETTEETIEMQQSQFKGESASEEDDSEDSQEEVSMIQTPVTEIIDYTDPKSLQYTLQPGYLSNWNYLYFFDGIEYTIDTSVEPRYDGNGNQIRDTKRVVSFTRNGKEISDTQIFAIACHRLPNLTLFNKMNLTKIVSTSTYTYEAYITSFISNIASAIQTIPSMKDNNHSVLYAKQNNYLLRSSVNASKLIESRDWLKDMIGQDEYGYAYYLADFQKEEPVDDKGPCLVVSALKTSITNTNVPVAVQASDKSGIKTIKYLYGRNSLTNKNWDTAKTILNGQTFQATKNGFYSVLAIDMLGNRRVSYLQIQNINKAKLEAPKVKTYTNRHGYIEGTALANAQIYFKVDSGKTYSTKVSAKGTFKYALPYQSAGKKVYVYIKSKSGKTSNWTIVTVKRTGPNKPIVANTKTNSRTIKGALRDMHIYPMILVNDKTLYMTNSTTYALYKKSKFYNKKYKVVYKKITVKSNATFYFTLPLCVGEKSKIIVKTIDVAYRVSSASRVKIIKSKPGTPKNPTSVSNASRSVTVYAYEKCSAAIAKTAGKKYFTRSCVYDSKSKMYAYTIRIPRCKAGSVMKVYFKNSKGYGKAISIKVLKRAPEMPTLKGLKAGAGNITGTVDMIEPQKKQIYTKVYIYINRVKYEAEVKSSGAFVLNLKKKLKKGDKVVVKAKNYYGAAPVLRTVVR